MKSRVFNYGGIAAAVILIAFGIGALVMGANGRDTVRTNISKESIVGTPDMTPAAIAAEAKKAGLKNVDMPSKSVAGETIDSGGEAKTFAEYMRIHALEGTGGQVYAQMSRCLDAKAKRPNGGADAGADQSANAEGVTGERKDHHT